ncbi:MAG TPA: hypothetical protein VHA11_12520, partial [Bryobacteraceae bacterium]|nr:hypothetical protein [Bryobacteraceae bacterium]
NVLSNQNPDPLIRYDFLSRDTGASAYWNPGWWKGFGLLADYTRSTLRSDILYVIPSQLTPDVSLYRENAHTGTLLADVPMPGGTHGPKLSFGGSFYRSQGSRPVRYWQPMARLALPITEHVQFNTEWRWYGMTQPFYLYEGFRSHQFTTSLRYTR